MKAFIVPSYTFTPGASGVGTVNLSGISGFDPKKLISIINQTRGAILYATASSTYKHSGISGTTVTLFVDTSTHSNTDVLQVVYEDATIENRLALLATEAKQDTSITRLNLLATEAKQDAQATLTGAVTETAPASDTASSGLNGRLQRIAQRITSLIALIPTSLGQKTMANSFAVTLASDQSALSTTQTALTASYAESLVVNTSGVTITAPAGAKWCKIQADEANTAILRVKIGATASTTSGIQLQSGRSEDFNIAGNISVFAESGSGQKVYVQFGA